MKRGVLQQSQLPVTPRQRRIIIPLGRLDTHRLGQHIQQPGIQLQRFLEIFQRFRVMLLHPLHKPQMKIGLGIVRLHANERAELVLGQCELLLTQVSLPQNQMGPGNCFVKSSITRLLPSSAAPKLRSFKSISASNKTARRFLGFSSIASLTEALATFRSPLPTRQSPLR